jgi:hypothetical protein
MRSPVRRQSEREACALRESNTQPMRERAEDRVENSVDPRPHRERPARGPVTNEGAAARRSSQFGGFIRCDSRAAINPFRNCLFRRSKSRIRHRPLSCRARASQCPTSPGVSEMMQSARYRPSCHSDTAPLRSVENNARAHAAPARDAGRSLGEPAIMNRFPLLSGRSA